MCGEPLPKGKSKYCSESCALGGRNRNRPTVTTTQHKKCWHCGKEYEVGSRSYKSKYCSEECRKTENKISRKQSKQRVKNGTQKKRIMVRNCSVACLLKEFGDIE